jgi:hypothetical protein
VILVIQAIALLCHVSGGGPGNYTSWSQQDAAQVKCQQWYVACVKVNTDLIGVDKGLADCVLKRKAD